MDAATDVAARVSTLIANMVSSKGRDLLTIGKRSLSRPSHTDVQLSTVRLHCQERRRRAMSFKSRKTDPCSLKTHATEHHIAHPHHVLNAA